MFFSNKALQTYERLDNVLKKDKRVASNRVLGESIKADILKVLQVYADVDASSACVEIDNEDNSNIILNYKVKLKRVKNFIIN